MMLAVFVANCTGLGPNYKRPKAIISPKFKEMRKAQNQNSKDPKAPQPLPGWELADPNLAAFPKGKWWTIYNDQQLNKMEDAVNINNQNIRQYEARYRDARAEINAVRAQLYPTLQGGLGFHRQSTGTHSRTAGTYITNGGKGVTVKDNNTRDAYSMGPSASWDLDLWGRIRRQIEAQETETQATIADLANARLSYQAELATTYFNLLYQDSLYDLLAKNVEIFEHSYKITHNQYEAGTGTPTAVLQSKTQLEQTRSQMTSTNVLRAQYEHALAVLMGKAPAEVTIEHGQLPSTIPTVPVSVPSTLLQRRPDIAAAERRIEEYNARIGEAIAAFFPDVTLNSQYYYSGDPVGSLVQVGNRVWSLGASASENIFQGGARTAQIREANAAYDENVAAYRQTVLTALQQTEDQLSNLRIQSERAQQQDVATNSAQKTASVALNQYKAGTVIYTTVINAQATALKNEETSLQIQHNRLTETVNLVQDIGGGWDPREMPSKHSMQQDNPFLPDFVQKDRNGPSPIHPFSNKPMTDYTEKERNEAGDPMGRDTATKPQKGENL